MFIVLILSKFNKYSSDVNNNNNKYINNKI